MIEHRVVFAAGHKGETTHVGEHGPGAILAIEPEQSALLWELVCREIATDGREALAQFRAVATVAAVAKRAEPLDAVSSSEKVRPLAPKSSSRFRTRPEVDLVAEPFKASDQALLHRLPISLIEIRAT